MRKWITFVATLAGVVAVAVVVVLSVPGCVSINDVMRQYGYEAMTPPTTKWEPGTVVEIVNGRPGAPQYLVAPSDLKMVSEVFVSDAPNATQSHKISYGLDVGVSVPETVKVKVQLKGGCRYSLVTTGNQLRTVKLFAFKKDFNSLVDRVKESYGSDVWSSFLEKGTIFYLSSLWYAKELEYKFYDEKGGEVKVDYPYEVIVAGGGKLESTKEGTLIYKGVEPICIGFQKRPITTKSGRPGAESTGNGQATIEPIEASPVAKTSAKDRKID